MVTPGMSEGATILVAGADGPLGTAIAGAFIAAGARVVLTAPGEAAARAVAASLGANCIGFGCDSAAPGQVAAAVARAWSLGPVAALVTVARPVPVPAAALDLSHDDWQAVVEGAVRTPYFTAVETARRMFEAGTGGAIVNVCAPGGAAVQQAASAALQQLTRTLAREWAPGGLRVNAIDPVPGASPDETAAAVVWAASEAAAGVTGAVIPVTAGPRPT